ncbi:ADP-ribose diphosphatase [Xenorhabdus nematophila]|uniref:ADP-ribose pyrophosphatase n=1 Tax=Xenorhabdus nematophila (strain ATCC 19061 / DSM 3370 / CCUG 14189 / LMG 1036 / NCIMB 9965 / AN6) TaxID=406817 RepID=D3VCR6_XENNA|nr:ADP-ribose diphosphatase [Xenorhabdus nematophila]CEE91405.1 adenosine diphosphate sugar pyrophosphatase (ADP-ribose pyrophosphatase) [Xenorhabdus nematophila str. Anatoliense]CEF33076.1 adenosine diphosphate sugar pyrophosphatase (ADP-ribose pyrophosphatase) [Xenorhabdus nematophila str. Websteri]AYA42094.1 ADP-ribose diphosphatase [Xenorhabdus nematophila]MBA0020816.1 ADP-ribose diphosphatase [Xenorhabdus nematophila]MCB4424064.1 ADP-ribose diphosphatase [Xenorhabdus nematophila]
MNEELASPYTFTKQDVEFISQKTLYRGFFKMTEYQFKHRLFRGGWSETVRREVFERGHAAVLLPYDPVRDEVVLIEQIRITAIESSDTPWLLEVIAGMIEAGEEAEQVVRREAVEEAGIEVKRCQPALSYLSSPGGTTERMNIFVGEVDASTASGVHGLEGEHEDIRVLVVSREQAYQWVEEGVIDNAASVIAIQWLALHHEKLRKEWLVNHS